MNNESKIIPSMLLLTGAAVGALSGLFIKALPLSAAVLLGFRFGVPFIILLPYVIKRKTCFGRKKIVFSYGAADFLMSSGWFSI